MPPREAVRTIRANAPIEQQATQHDQPHWQHDFNQVFQPPKEIHGYKIQKLSRAIESWLLEHSWEGKWQIDVAAVRLVPRETYATIKIIPNIVLN